jgi:hypothetical protein
MTTVFPILLSEAFAAKAATAEIVDATGVWEGETFPD